MTLKQAQDELREALEKLERAEGETKEWCAAMVVAEWAKNLLKAMEAADGGTVKIEDRSDQHNEKIQLVTDTWASQSGIAKFIGKKGRLYFAEDEG